MTTSANGSRKGLFFGLAATLLVAGLLAFRIQSGHAASDTRADASREAASAKHDAAIQVAKLRHDAVVKAAANCKGASDVAYCVAAAVGDITAIKLSTCRRAPNPGSCVLEVTGQLTPEQKLKDKLLRIKTCGLFNNTAANHIAACLRANKLE
jgi:hypothetical protein